MQSSRLQLQKAGLVPFPQLERRLRFRGLITCPKFKEVFCLQQELVPDYYWSHAGLPCHRCSMITETIKGNEGFYPQITGNIIGPWGNSCDSRFTGSISHHTMEHKWVEWSKISQQQTCFSHNDPWDRKSLPFPNCNFIHGPVQPDSFRIYTLYNIHHIQWKSYCGASKMAQWINTLGVWA